MSNSSSTYTAFEYLAARVKFDVPKRALKAIFVRRGMEVDAAYADYEGSDALRLAYADMLKWYVLGASKKNNTSDTDNGWTHSGGGYEIDDDDRNLLITEANAIYDELEPDSVIKNKTTFKMNSLGIRHANYDMWDNPLPHIVR